MPRFAWGALAATVALACLYVLFPASGVDSDPPVCWSYAGTETVCPGEGTALAFGAAALGFGLVWLASPMVNAAAISGTTAGLIRATGCATFVTGPKRSGNTPRAPLVSSTAARQRPNRHQGATMLRLRIELPDQPGSLARVTWMLGVLGADIAAISVLDRDAGRALDDITLEWRGQPRERLIAALRSTPGVRPVGVWSVRGTPESLPVVDVVAAMVRSPSSAMRTLVDAAPLLFAAEWAVLADAAGDVLMTSAGADPPTTLPAGFPSRVMAAGTADARLATAPVPGRRVLTIGRGDGPPFHRTELNRVARLVEVLDVLAGFSRLEPVR